MKKLNHTPILSCNKRNLMLFKRKMASLTFYMKIVNNRKRFFENSKAQPKIPMFSYIRLITWLMKNGVPFSPFVPMHLQWNNHKNLLQVFLYCNANGLIELRHTPCSSKKPFMLFLSWALNLKMEQAVARKVDSRQVNWCSRGLLGVGPPF